MRPWLETEPPRPRLLHIARPLPRMPRPQFYLLLFLMSAAGLVITGCSKEEPVPEFVARVGDQYLQRVELEALLASMPEGVDSTEAQKQIIEQWVANKLLYEEAQRRGLRNEPEVRRLLEESEQSVLVSALLSRLYDEEAASASASDLTAYFERHKEQLRLREPFVQIRYLSNPSADSIRVARNLLQRAPTSERDSVWSAVTARFAIDPSGSTALTSTFYPESRLLTTVPPVQDAVSRLQAGQISEIIEYDDSYHFVQVAERVPAGEVPRIEWVQDELLRRLSIQGRKQMYAREVQRLRNEALAREELEVPE